MNILKPPVPVCTSPWSESLDEPPDDPRGLFQDREVHTFLICVAMSAKARPKTRDDASGQREEVGGVAAA